MILGIYAFKDNNLGCYTNPFYNDVPAENLAVGTTRSIQGAVPEKRALYKHKVLYRIGSFDDITGKITSEDPLLVLDCDEVIAAVENYGREENSKA